MNDHNHIYATATMGTSISSAICTKPTDAISYKPYIYYDYIAFIEKDNSITKAYNVAGMKIKCEEKFNNKTKQMFLDFSGKGKVLDKELTFEEKFYVDTDIYDRYDWNIKNGVLYVTLYEKINPRPDFKRVEKPAKKTETAEVEN